MENLSYSSSHLFLLTPYLQFHNCRHFFSFICFQAETVLTGQVELLGFYLLKKNFRTKKNLGHPMDQLFQGVQFCHQEEDSEKFQPQLNYFDGKCSSNQLVKTVVVQFSIHATIATIPPPPSWLYNESPVKDTIVTNDR